MDISQHLIFERKKRILKVWYLVVSIFYFKVHGVGLSMSPYIQIAKHTLDIYYYENEYLYGKLYYFLLLY